MSLPVFALVAMNLLFIGALPRIFFRKSGRLNLAWWGTAAPFLIAGATVVLGLLDLWKPFPLSFRSALEIAAVVPAAGSIALIAFTLGTHRIPIALWHQRDDAPEHLVTWGAYARIRHPFYASFLCGLLGALLAFPHGGTLAALALGTVVLTVTARREERRLSASAFGEAYRAYMKRTGRFLPRMGGTGS